MIFVLDNSVAMRWCFEPGTHRYAEFILEKLEAGDTAVVPVMWLYEVSAVLAREQNRGRLSEPDAQGFLADLQSLNITIDQESAGRILTDVHQLALAHRLTSYDAAYLELAMRRGLPIATLDDDLAKASRAAGVSVIGIAAP